MPDDVDEEAGLAELDAALTDEEELAGFAVELVAFAVELAGLAEDYKKSSASLYRGQEISRLRTTVPLLAGQTGGPANVDGGS